MTLPDFDAFPSNWYQTLSLSNPIFQNCVEQMYDDQRMHVSKNPTFAEEFHMNIRSYLAQIEPRIGKIQNNILRHLPIKNAEL